jgi:hypothetical protein
MEKMNTEKETYIQKTFFQTGAPPFAASLPFLIVSMYCLLSKKPLLWAVLLLVIGLLLIALGIKKAKQDTEHILRFVREKSVHCHRCSPPLTIASLLDCLKQEGFAVTEYPFANYYCCRDLDPKHRVHFFVANNDTPDCPEAENYSALFIRTVGETALSLGCQYLLDLEYGSGLEQKSPQYIQAVREGIMHDKQGILFGFRLAYDTQDDTLYCAEAVTRITWHRSEVLAIYANELLKKLFFR